MGYIKSRSTLPANRRVDLNTEIRQGSNERYGREISEAVLGTLDIDENLDARVKAVLAGDTVGESSSFITYAKTREKVVTFSCTNGSVGATVEGIGIQSGAYVEHGKTVVFTITPNEGYEYTGTNPESVVVTEDITKAYECTFKGLKLTSDGTISVYLEAYELASDTTNGSTNTSNKCQYSTNGTDWEWISDSSSSPTVVTTGTMYLKGNNPNGWSEFDEEETGFFYMFKFTEDSALVNVSGNVMSLIDDGACTTTEIPNAHCFHSLFWANTDGGEVSKIVSAENLVLPATTLKNNCYQQLFRGCTTLTSAPTLTAETLATACYTEMFQDCTALNEIHCLATDISAAACTNDWLRNVSASGDFYGKTAAGWTTGSASGIPSGWTAHLD